jgi:hypothetical protein
MPVSCCREFTIKKEIDMKRNNQYRATALGYLKRFGSVTVLNGHIHQVVQKVEGNVSFHTAMSTAFPQPAPGPGRMAVPAGKLESVLGVTDVKVVRGHSHLAVIDSTLAV